MPAHVWQLHVSPGKVQDFQNILSSLVELARQQDDIAVFSSWRLANLSHPT
jgi:hypothetical protein